MNAHPKTIAPDVLAAVALQEMEAHAITQLVVIDGGRRPIGVVHLHELVKAGLGSDANEK
jgi:arabinose-5-phosphate isomerase